MVGKSEEKRSFGRQRNELKYNIKKHKRGGVGVKLIRSI
jgi:hypothetical protein